MSIDLAIFSTKLSRYRKLFSEEVSSLSKVTGIDARRLVELENGTAEPTGDEILILADHFLCDFNYFISNERKATFDKTELLFRTHGKDLSVSDRWAIQEIIYLAECEEYLDSVLKTEVKKEFRYIPTGTNFKKHGIDAAIALREYVSPKANEFNLNIYQDFRKTGFKIYRRKLENSSISGVCIEHESIGKLIVVNHSEDIYRQRFTVAHEVAHAIFDNMAEGFALSFQSRYGEVDPKERRANAFAATFLVPIEVLHTIPDNRVWNGPKLIEWASKIKVSTTVLRIRLENARLLTEENSKALERFTVPSQEKIDPEFVNVSPSTRSRLEFLFRRGLSSDYVRKCAEAKRINAISASRMAEMLLTSESELQEINGLFQLGLQHES